MASPAAVDGSVSHVDIPNGERIAYRHRPGEIPVVLLHGNITSSKHWDLVLESMDERFELYAMDMRGFGESSYRTPIDSLEALADDVAGFADAVDLDRFGLWGWSTGGGVAMVVAARHPERVDRLVLMAPVSTRGYPTYDSDESGTPTGEVLRTREELANDPVVVGPILAAHEAEDRGTFRAIWDQVIYTHNAPDPDRYEAYIDDMLTQRNTLDIYHALGHFNISEEATDYGEGSGLAGDVTAPTLLVRGDRDMIISREMAETTVADLSGTDAEFVELSDCGHSPLVDDLDGLLGAVEPFLLADN